VNTPNMPAMHAAKVHKFSLALSLLGALACVATSASADSHGRWAKGRILIQPRAGLSDKALDNVLMKHRGHRGGRLRALNLHVVDLPAGADEAISAELMRRDPNIKFAEVDRIVEPDQIANDPNYSKAWHLPKIGAPAAWDAALGNDVVIAVLDSGVDAAHPDLQGKLLPGWNFWDNDANTSDVYGHGTKVAGAAAAAGNNGVGVTGVAWNAKIMPVRVSDTAGYTYWSTVASALYWAADHGAKVANISYSVQGSKTVQAAAQYMRGKGGVVVNSAGNSGAFDASAAHDALISVSATGAGDTRASWSSFGNYVDFAAPGVGIWTTVKGGSYGSVSGTSFSSPITAGVVALMMSADPSLTPMAIEDILKSTAVDLGTPGFDQYYGFGRINAAGALQRVAGVVPTPPDTIAPSVTITAPGPGSVSGAVAVNVSASDNVAVSKVELYANGGLVATDMTAPYQFAWDTTKIANGGAALLARAHDAAGNMAPSATVAVSIANAVIPPPDTTAPSVAITAPGAGSVSCLVSVSVSATDNVAVTKVELYANNTLIATDTSAPYQFVWDTTKLANGAAALVARAYDAAGNVASSTAVATTVANAVTAPPDTIKPTVRLVAPANPVSGIVRINITASDNVGIGKIAFNLAGAPKAQILSATSFSYDWDTGTLAPGSYWISATVWDTSGNYAVTPLQLVIKQ
jgi:thermitase